MYRKCPNPNCNGNRRDKVALRTTCNRNVKFKIIKIRTGCQYVRCFYFGENPNWAACGPRVGHSWAREITEQNIPSLTKLRYQMFLPFARFMELHFFLR